VAPRPAIRALLRPQTNETTPKRTPEEQALIDDLSRMEGRSLTVQEENLAIKQAEGIGLL
jgi:hypothetical protein